MSVHDLFRSLANAEILNLPLMFCKQAYHTFLILEELYKLEYLQNKMHVLIKLKLVSAIFLSNFYFPPNDSPLKIMKNVFYFI